MTKKKLVTHDERRQQRQAMASAVAAGEDIYAVARRFGVVPAWVKQCCKTFGVDVQRGRVVPATQDSASHAAA